MSRLGPSIFGRVLGSFVLLVALPTLALVVALVQSAQGDLYQAAAERARDAGDQMSRILTGEMEMVSYQTSALSFDPDIQGSVQRLSTAERTAERMEATMKLDQTLLGYLNVTNRAGIVSILDKTGRWEVSGNLSNRTLLDWDPTALVAEARARRGHVVFQNSIDSQSLTAAIAPGREVPVGAIDVLILRVQSVFFEQLRERASAPQKTEVILFDRDHAVVWSSIPAVVKGSDGTPFFSKDTSRRSVTVGGQVWLTSLQQITPTGWDLLTLGNEAQVTARFRFFEQASVWGIFFLVLLFGTYAAIVFSRISEPISQVIHSLDRVAGGDWGFQIPTPKLRELETLVTSFNRMSGELNRLSGELTAVELEALRHQINPHFLANTLNVVRLMAASARAKAIEQVTADLMLLLTKAFEGGTNLTPLEEEWKALESYVRIMQIRSGTQFALNRDLEPGTEGALVLRMSLQPLVENSILHGFAGLDHPGVITVRSRKLSEEGLLMIEIEDNGTGYAGEAFRRSPHDQGPGPDKMGRIGLGNVEKRLRLAFGERGKLWIDPHRNSGCLIRLTLPWQTAPAPSPWSENHA